MSRKQSAAAYKGLVGHVHVTVTKQQAVKVRRLAKRAGLSLSEYMRGVIDDLEGSK